LGTAVLDGLIFALVWRQFSSGHDAASAVRAGAVLACAVFVSFVLQDLVRRERARRRLADADADAAATR
jgi:hypothetical protein